jgi:DNA processing protein
MSDATIVVETGVSGGSMITVEFANGYNRDVFAFPGRTTDNKSAGCNQLIRNNKANLLTNAGELAELMGWQKKDDRQKEKQKKLFIELTENEKKVFELVMEKGQIHVDEINLRSGLSSSAVAAAVLSLELQNVLISKPGKVYSTS